MTTWDPTRHSTRAVLSLSDTRMGHIAGDSIASGAGIPAKSSGKWYFEVLVGGSSLIGSVGIVNDSWTETWWNWGLGDNAYSWTYRNDGRKWHASWDQAFGDPWTSGDIIGVAIDLNQGRIWFSKNGVWQGSGDPENDLNPAYTGIDGIISPAATHWYEVDYFDKKFDEADLTYTPPSGFFALDVDVDFETVESGIGFSDYISAISLTQRLNSGMGFSAVITGRKYVTNAGIAVGIGFSENLTKLKESNFIIESGLGLSDSADALNFSEWLKANEDHVVYRYFARLTGGPDGLADHSLSGLKSIQFRMRNGEPSYLSVVLKYDPTEAEAIVTRQNGQIVIEMSGFIGGVESLREELLRAKYYSHRYDRGGLSQSTTLVGYDTREYPSNRVALENVTRETQLADGRMQYRCANPDFYLRPGDVATYGPHEITVGTITCIISPNFQYMEVAEAQV